MSRDLEPARRFVQRLGDLVRRVEVTVAADEELLRNIFQMRYKAYLKEKYIEPDPAEMLHDAHDRDSNATIFAFWIDAKLVATLRVHFVDATHRQSPAREAFPSVVDPLLDQGEALIDANRMAVNFEMLVGIQEMPYVISRVGILAAEYFRVGTISVAQRTGHQAFYRREFQAKVVAPPRAYPSVKVPTGLMFIDYSRNREAILERHPFYNSTPDERERLFGDLARRCGIAAPAV